MQNESSPRSPDWTALPLELTALILQKVGPAQNLIIAQNVCSTWRNVAKDPSLWRSIDMGNFGGVYDMGYDLEKLCRAAVDRSAGGLVDINIEYFGTDHLLAYIAQRSSQLKRLRLLCCYPITDEGLSRVAAKFPLLEDLEISYCSLSKKSLEVVGCSCPELRSFKLNHQGYKRPYKVCDEEALAIGKTMPGLRYLQIFGNKLTNTGLMAILDGCPRLESLDLRWCFNVKQDELFWLKCRERIKDIRRPNDPTDDYIFHNGLPDISSDEVCPSEFSNTDISEYEEDYYEEDYYEFSDGNDFSDDGD